MDVRGFVNRMASVYGESSPERLKVLTEWLMTKKINYDKLYVDYIEREEWFPTPHKIMKYISGTLTGSEAYSQLLGYVNDQYLPIECRRKLPVDLIKAIRSSFGSFRNFCESTLPDNQKRNLFISAYNDVLNCTSKQNTGQQRMITPKIDKRIEPKRSETIGSFNDLEFLKNLYEKTGSKIIHDKILQKEAMNGTE